MTRDDAAIEAALNRLHHAINERRKSTTRIAVEVEDLKIVLYDYAKQCRKGEPQ